ncbi:MAG: Asp-tRNA(Asn)/Glu-tRNA(Gln) amidotransferase subunit GatC [Candidatus Eisenbacteria bacterium]|uniref:Aspartyl/glutamyl-tRNA(Asn/Gln) amidotransferase subunit C n=1 Tax=Eiseniibacteriota bacterium TaxID=2212470 RepID=A0A7Y2EER8_UNCEI|nr:Asp-tRNA(Asn)/Glu-tRNA(Gln) amidotransferase subunit GatC [Candidatus Eisenbacteria bacterium]
MSISRDDVLHIAKLAHLALSDEEVDAFAKDLDAILGYVERLKNEPGEGAEPHALPSRFREDEARPWPNLDTIVDAAPESSENMFRVPRSIDER